MHVLRKSHSYYFYYLPHEKKSEGRMSNSGPPIRQSYTVDFKVEFVETISVAPFVPFS